MYLWDIAWRLLNKTVIDTPLNPQGWLEGMLSVAEHISHTCSATLSILLEQRMRNRVVVRIGKQPNNLPGL